MGKKTSRANRPQDVVWERTAPVAVEPVEVVKKPAAGEFNESKLVDAARSVKLVRASTAKYVTERNELIRKAHASGMTGYRIAKLTGISRQGIAKLVAQDKSR